MRSLKEGLKFQAHVIKSGFLPTIVTTNQLMNLYSKHGLVDEAHKLFEGMPERNVFSWNTIINAYIRTRNFGKAKCLFDSSPFKDSVSYNSMISGYARSDSYSSEAIELFIQMQFDKDTARIDEFTLTTMLNLVANLRLLHYGKQLHSFMVKSGNDLSNFALSSLIDMYSKCGSFSDACRVFNGHGCCQGLVDTVVNNALLAACYREGKIEIAREVFSSNPELIDDVSWNTMISGCAQNGYEEEAVELFKRMAEKGYRWDEHTFGSVLAACSALKCLKLGKEVHAWVLKDGMCSNPFISSGIVDIYSKCGNLRYAESVYNSVGRSNVYAATSMIVGYSAKGDVLEARRLFDSVPQTNFVMWTSIISGYVKLQRCEEAFVLFREYAVKEITAPDAVILVSLLSACAIRASVGFGKQIHAYSLRIKITLDEKAVSALIDMYSKCGYILYAQRLFHRVSIRDTIMYNVMIAGCAHHGHEHEAIRLFEEMTKRGLHPDAVTFIALLSACRHCGLVEAGEKYFCSMTKNYSIPHEMDHYACMVDLYGRSNQLEKAAAFIEEMPIEPDSIILSAFLNACRTNKNLELARMAEKRLLEIEGNNGSRYFQLASVYASGGEWDEMGRMMRRMKEKDVKKTAGCSWVQFGNEVHIFKSGDASHLEAEAIYSILGCLINELFHKATVAETCPPLWV